MGLRNDPGGRVAGENLGKVFGIHSCMRRLLVADEAGCGERNTTVGTLAQPVVVPQSHEVIVMATRIIRTVAAIDAQNREVLIHEMERFEPSARTAESLGGNWVGSWLATSDGEGAKCVGEGAYQTNSGRILRTR